MSLRTLLLLGGGAYLVSEVLKLKKAGDELAITIGNIGVSKIENASLILWAEVWFDNFTKTVLHIQQPTVKIFLGDTSTEVGHVLPSNDITEVPGNGRNAEPCTLRLAIPLSNIPSALAALLAGGKANKEIIIQVNSVVNGFPYSAQTKYTI